MELFDQRCENAAIVRQRSSGKDRRCEASIRRGGNHAAASAAMRCAEQLSGPVPEIEERAHCPQRSSKRDARHSEPAHQDEIQHDVEAEVEDAAVKDQIGAAHGNDKAVVDAAGDEKRNLNCVHREHGRHDGGVARAEFAVLEGNAHEQPRCRQSATRR